MTLSDNKPYQSTASVNYLLTECTIHAQLTKEDLPIL